MPTLFTQCPGDTVQTGTGKVVPARKFKCTTAARGESYICILLWSVAKIDNLIIKETVHVIISDPK